nr:deoxyguanosinetriphosphate triphosphohydrolase [candidate division Zixibacteria bacterium]
MVLTPRQRIEEYERKILAGYACYSSLSRGRQYPQAEHPIRTAFQRDRDRVIHSTAFRRMEYKTQVFVNHEGDHYRTRLTHTIEVAQISRTIARALGLNEDLAEAIALVHDLGHTPFGHSGEDVLDKLMTGFGGFNHNRQSLRVVDLLERRYPNHPGLNLTYEVREGIVKHETGAGPLMPEIFPPDEKPTLEASLVDLADAIAYNSHDVDDGLRSGIFSRDDLEEVPICVAAREESERVYPDLDDDYRHHSIIRILVDWMVTDLINRTHDNLRKNCIETLDDVRRSEIKLVVFSEWMESKMKTLKDFLMRKMYRHPRMLTMAEQARLVIVRLFEFYRGDPQALHVNFKDRLGTEPVEIIVSDFIAGMTDRFAYRVYERLN